MSGATCIFSIGNMVSVAGDSMYCALPYEAMWLTFPVAVVISYFVQ
jgi:hypothetical protein